MYAGKIDREHSMSGVNCYQTGDLRSASRGFENYTQRILFEILLNQPEIRL